MLLDFPLSDGGVKEFSARERPLLATKSTKAQNQKNLFELFVLLCGIKTFEARLIGDLYRVKRMRVALITTGSYGDINPLIFVGKALKARGHTVTFATSRIFEREITAAGLEFYPVRPHSQPEALLQPTNKPGRLLERAIREVFFAGLEDSFEDLRALAVRSDLLISHMLAFAAPLVAEATGVRWISLVLQPFGFLSRFERLVVPSELSASGLATLDSWTSHVAMLQGRTQGWLWAAPVRQLRVELGLTRGSNPIYDDQHSPELVLALFSALLAQPKPDWPACTRITGFVFDEEATLPPEAERFLQSGPAPIIATLGSHSEHDLTGFFAQSVFAAVTLGMRCMLLGSGTPEFVETLCRIYPQLRSAVAGFTYIPYTAVFPRAAVILHHGGIGSIAAALHAGKPMLIVPLGNDQLQNAMCAVELGCARAVSPHRYDTSVAITEISTLLSNTRYSTAAALAGEFVRNENGTNAACAAIEGCTLRTGSNSNEKARARPVDGPITRQPE